jgi:hypothetical protein
MSDRSIVINKLNRICAQDRTLPGYGRDVTVHFRLKQKTDTTIRKEFNNMIFIPVKITCSEYVQSLRDTAL